MMRDSSFPPRSAAKAVGLDPELLRSGSLLIYCRSSLVLSVLIYSAITSMVYSDLYVHLIRRIAGGAEHGRIFPRAFFVLLVAMCLYLAHRLKPTLERVAWLLLAMNLSVLFFRRRMEANSESYLALCVLSLALDLGILTAVISFYRQFPNYLEIMQRQEEG